MSNVPLQSMTFPGLPDTYTVPQVDDTLSVSGAAADAAVTSAEVGELKSAVSGIDTALNKSTHSSNYLNPNEICRNVIAQIIYSFMADKSWT